MKPLGSHKQVLVRLSLMLAMLTLLAGCLYPEERLAQNRASGQEAVRNMQATIDQYKADTGLLPIRNTTADTPLYEKYVVDLAKLQRMNYISEIPAVAFEKGGTSYFLVLNPDDEPLVRLMDLVTVQTVNDVQEWVTAFYRSSGAYPFADEVYPGYYYIDYEAMNRRAPALSSVYSGSTLPLIVSASGTVYTDYGIDLMRLLQREDVIVEPGQDLRELLVQQALFVPVKAPPYQEVNGEPQAQPEN